MINNKLVVGITQGDGNGIGYEVIIKALADARILDSFTPVIYGSSKVFGFYRKQIHNLDPVDTFVINSAKDARARKINIVNCLPDNVYVEPGQSTPEAAKSAMKALECAVSEIKQGFIDVLVTGPINKKAIVAEGFGFPGHTEFLQNAFGVKDVMAVLGIVAALAFFGYAVTTAPQYTLQAILYTLLLGLFPVVYLIAALKIKRS